MVDKCFVMGPRDEPIVLFSTYFSFQQLLFSYLFCSIFAQYLLSINKNRISSLIVTALLEYLDL